MVCERNSSEKEGRVQQPINLVESSSSQATNRPDALSTTRIIRKVLSEETVAFFEKQGKMDHRTVLNACLTQRTERLDTAFCATSASHTRQQSKRAGNRSLKDLETHDMSYPNFS
jgi:hypothetical protein